MTHEASSAGNEKSFAYFLYANFIVHPVIQSTERSRLRSFSTILERWSSFLRRVRRRGRIENYRFRIALIKLILPRHMIQPLLIRQIPPTVFSNPSSNGSEGIQPKSFFNLVASIAYRKSCCTVFHKCDEFR